MPKSFYTVWVFTKINTRRFFRDKTAIFFTVLFPLIFLFIFGSLNSGDGSVSLNVAVVNQSNSEFSKQFVNQLKKGDTAVKVDEKITSLSAAREKMARAQLDAAIVLPKDFGAAASGKSYPTGDAQIYYTQNNQSSAQVLQTIIESVFKNINQKLVKSDTPFTVSSRELKEKSLSQFDYTFAGLLGFAIIGMGIFGPINVFPELKKMGVLRRLSTTPIKVWQYFLTIMLSQLVIGSVSILAMFFAAMTVFKLNIIGNYLELAAFIAFGIILILGVGLALGGWAKNERQAAPLSNIIVFPMMFLSGTFFPRFLMPEWLQNLSAYIPLTPVIDGIRLISTEGKHLVDVAPQLGLMSIWLVVIYAIAFRVFRWE
jgi:ABC-2 type transport system permease protein